MTSPKFNWNIYLSYISEHDSNYPIKYTLTGGTELSFVSGDGIPFRVQETSSQYILTSPVPHGISQGEYILINGNYYYINSVGNQYYRSEKYVINILKSQLSGTTLNVLINGKRCVDINDTANSTSQYYVHKHKTLTSDDEYILDKLGFESPIWEDERKLLYENSAGENDVLVVRDRMESMFFTFKEPYTLSGITNNLGYTPTELYATVIFRNGNGYFNYPPKVGYSFHLHDTWIDDHYDGSISYETGITYSTFWRGKEFYKGNEVPIGTELYGAFIEYNPKELKERVISESFHKITINSLIFDHGQTLNTIYSGASQTNPFGLLYQPHYRFKLRELSPYIESSDPNVTIGNLPENAKYFPDEKIWRWRDLYEHGYIDPDGYGTNYPYMNDMHYIFQDIGFYIRNEKLFNNKKDQVVSFYDVGDQNICHQDVIHPSVTPSPTPSVSLTPGLPPSTTPTPSISPSLTPSISTSAIADFVILMPSGISFDKFGNLKDPDYPTVLSNGTWTAIEEDDPDNILIDFTKSGNNGEILEVWVYGGEVLGEFVSTAQIRVIRGSVSTLLSICRDGFSEECD